jgi:hypothetical protein
MSRYRQFLAMRRGSDFVSPAFPVLDDAGAPVSNSLVTAAEVAFKYDSSDVACFTLSTTSDPSFGSVSILPSEGISFTIARAALQLFVDRAGEWELLATVAGSVVSHASGNWSIRDGVVGRAFGVVGTPTDSSDGGGSGVGGDTVNPRS